MSAAAARGDQSQLAAAARPVSGGGGGATGLGLYHRGHLADSAETGCRYLRF